MVGERFRGRRGTVAAALTAVALLLAGCIDSVDAVTPGDGSITVAFTLTENGCVGCTLVAEAATDDTFTTIVASAEGTSSPLTITGLTNGTPYRVRLWVRAASGGVVSEHVVDGERSRVHTFSDVGDATFEVHFDATVGPLSVDVLAVGGGGAGGASAGGGGGGGGVARSGTRRPLGPGTHAITVGAGGTPSGTNGPGMDGGDSVVRNPDGTELARAFGGGGGMSMENSFPGPGGRDGGSGGGGTRATNDGGASTAGAPGGDALQVTVGEFVGSGSEGGAGVGVSGSDTQGGGGGGATEVGVTPSAASPGGDGGAGIASTISGTSVTYGGGGGGGVGSAYVRAGAGGAGGGGAGAVTTAGVVAEGAAGTDGLGGGGGGGSALDGDGALGGAGGSGVVILSYVLGSGLHVIHPEPVTPVGGRGSSPAATGPTLTCAPAEPIAGGSLTCVVSSADPDIDILWRAADGDQTFDGVVRTGSDGTGTFSLTVPRSAFGRTLTVELVAWLAPQPVGVVRPVVPSRIPAGEGSARSPLGVPLGVALSVAFGLLSVALLRSRARAPVSRAARAGRAGR